MRQREAPGAAFLPSLSTGQLFQPRQIGVLDEIARAPNAGQWTWALSGTRPNPPGFVWRGQERTLDEARAEDAACWTEGLRWAGLEQSNRHAGVRHKESGVVVAQFNGANITKLRAKGVSPSTRAVACRATMKNVCR
jgi:hypothetical protein